jgi:hypothetical protein
LSNCKKWATEQLRSVQRERLEVVRSKRELQAKVLAGEVQDERPELHLMTDGSFPMENHRFYTKYQELTHRQRINSLP